MLVQFGNNWIQKIPLTAKLDSACGLVQFWLSSEFFSSNYFQIGQHVVLLHILIIQCCDVRNSNTENLSRPSLDIFRLCAQSVCLMFHHKKKASFRLFIVFSALFRFLSIC